MSNKQVSIGRQIRALAAIRGLNQRELSDKTGIHPSIISLICNDKAAPTSLQAKAIKKVLRWPKDAETAFRILAGDGDEPSIQ